MTDAQRALIAPFVSEMEGPVFAIAGLPEEVIAVVFAYVSRRPHGFRENLAELLATGEITQAPTGHNWLAPSAKAAAFHERWVVGYGHSSVAEHAVVHLGVEGISRLASAQLELSNPYLSFTEYSQRYQQPKAGAFAMPVELADHPRWKERFSTLQNRLYQSYEALLDKLVTARASQEPAKPDEREAQYQRRLRRASFEDARYVLSLAVRTSLGMTTNARALGEALRCLAASPYGEVRQLAEALREQASKVTPTLLRHVEPSVFERDWYDHQPPAVFDSSGELALIDYTGAGSAAAETTAVSQLIGQALPFAADASPAERLQQLERYLQLLGPFDALPAAFTSIRYRFRFSLSEAAFHQLLRHGRRMLLVAGAPTTAGTPVIPPAVSAAGGEQLLIDATEAAKELFDELVQDVPQAAAYTVTNAHRRQVICEIDLAELYHFLNLRSTAEAQWEIRALAGAMQRAVARVHPHLIGFAVRRA
ncbi:MAG: FAD-dependent thymidylate synthase [Firmicutes bacterium]|nr:FAD-dependent thymidylate synthase [Bacillota bacterium]